MKNKIELLLPAGDKEKAYYALNYGADAIFLGAKAYSLRARASNFDIQDIADVVNYAHQNNKKVYLVTNVICHNFLAADFVNFFKKVASLKLDGFICADPFIIKTLHDQFGECEIQISTQQSITNSKAALFFKKFNAKRVVLAREMTFDEIKATSDALKDLIEVEIFIHGAVCISYSGRCMMSNNFSLRDSNVGGCAQSCRWMYHLCDNDLNHFFTMSAKDMNYLDYLQRLMKLNISCFKVEGRMKSINYIATVAKTYHQLMDNYYNQFEIDTKKLKHDLLTIENRATDNAFLIEANKDKMLYHDEQKNVNQNFIFTIDQQLDQHIYAITSRNYFEINDKIILITPKNEYKIKILKAWNEMDSNLSVIHTPMTKLVIKIDQNINDWQYGIGRKDE